MKKTYISLFWVMLFIVSCQNKYNESPLSKNFYFIVEQSQRSTLDLSRITAIAWDEIVFLSPYEDICDLGITGFSPGNKNCWSTKDDGDCYLLFLKEGILVGKVAIDRKRIDLTTAKIEKKRIKKEDAIFQYTSKEDFAKIFFLKKPDLSAVDNAIISVDGTITSKTPTVGDPRLVKIQFTVDKIEKMNGMIYIKANNSIVERANGDVVQIMGDSSVKINDHGEEAVKSCMNSLKIGSPAVITGDFSAGLPANTMKYVQVHIEVVSNDILRCN